MGAFRGIAENSHWLSAMGAINLNAGSLNGIGYRLLQLVKRVLIDFDPGFLTHISTSFRGEIIITNKDHASKLDGSAGLF